MEFVDQNGFDLIHIEFALWKYPFIDDLINEQVYGKLSI